MASWKDMKIVIQVGHPEGWGKVLELPVNKDRSILGFHSHHLTQKKMDTSAVKGHLPSLLDTFTSVGHLKYDIIYVVEGDSGMLTKCASCIRRLKVKNSTTGPPWIY